MKNLLLRSLLTVLPIAFLLISCSDENNCNTIGASCDDGNPDTYDDVYDSNCDCAGTLNMFVDSRDGKTYHTVTIGTQTWMAENLDFAAAGSWCVDDLPANCTTYGHLYDWYTGRTGCPTGWHLPSDAEWDVLAAYLGGDLVAGGKLKETGTAHWNLPNTAATNSSGFTALPAGYRHYTGAYYDIADYGYWWSDSELDADNGRLKVLYSTAAFINGSHAQKVEGMSVRCIRD